MVQGDRLGAGYAGYQALAEASDVRMAFCRGHVRRRFYELTSASPAPIASEALARIGELSFGGRLSGPVS